ncbi:hypothetical protein J1N35_029211 [Gossypium stocksii]|uniref:Uncharacterized protein n=1 Tax=Gossypium stocksii TaxID=47602 RepID=A0A9D3ZSW7_9ROSI|nr:hypothetical protein J1N35_029211 [Gossypium stocksii]
MASVSPDVFVNEAMSLKTSTIVPSSSSLCVLDGERICRVVQSFPRHKTVKLKEETFVQWQHRLKLIMHGYSLISYIYEAFPIPPQFVPDPERKLVSNPEFIYFHQQDKLLALWSSYVNNEQVDIVFVGLSIYFKAVVAVASFALEPLKLDCLTDIFFECESRQRSSVISPLQSPGSVAQVHHVSFLQKIVGYGHLASVWPEKSLFRPPTATACPTALPTTVVSLALHTIATAEFV